MLGQKLLRGSGAVWVNVINRSRSLERVDPLAWNIHRFGLPRDRWDQISSGAYWVTGAGTGYGRSIACALAAAGAQVFLTGRRREKLEATLEEMRQLAIDTNKCYLLPADISCQDEVEMASETVMRHCRSLQGLINSAALPSRPGSRFPLQKDPVTYWEKLFATNVTAPWLLTRTIFPHMISGGSVRVLFLTSEAGWASTSGTGMYNVSKAALNSLCVSMAREYAARYPNGDIQINGVQPGEARTEMNQGSHVSPYAVVSIVLLLLSHPEGGPNGKFFHRDGRHLYFCYTSPYERALM